MDDIEARHKLRVNELIRIELYKQLKVLDEQDAQCREVLNEQENQNSN